MMASYSVNKRAVAHAQRLIDARHYVVTSDWGESQPSADDENTFLENHSWEEYGEWHLGLTDDANDDTKARMGSCTATSAAFTGWVLLPVGSAQRSGSTRNSSSLPINCSSGSIRLGRNCRGHGAIRKLIYGMNLTLDGHIAAPGDDIGWSAPSDELFQWWLDQERAIGLLLYGL